MKAQVKIKRLFVAIVDVADYILWCIVGRKILCQDKVPDVGFARQTCALGDDDSVFVFPATLSHVSKNAHRRGKRILLVTAAVVDPAVGILGFVGDAEVNQCVNVLLEQVVLDAHHFAVHFHFLGVLARLSVGSYAHDAQISITFFIVKTFLYVIQKLSFQREPAAGIVAASIE